MRRMHDPMHTRSLHDPMHTRSPSACVQACMYAACGVRRARARGPPRPSRASGACWSLWRAPRRRSHRPRRRRHRPRRWRRWRRRRAHAAWWVRRRGRRRRGTAACRCSSGACGRAARPSRRIACRRPRAPSRAPSTRSRPSCPTCSALGLAWGLRSGAGSVRG